MGGGGGACECRFIVWVLHVCVSQLCVCVCGGRACECKFMIRVLCVSWLCVGVVCVSVSSWYRCYMYVCRIVVYVHCMWGWCVCV